MLSIIRHIRPLAAAAIMFTIAASPAHASSTPTDQQPSAMASFEGRPVRLADGWGQARACTSDGQVVRCYRSETEMDTAEGGLPSQQTLGVSPSTACALPAVRLYRGTSWGGAVLQLTTMYTIIDLAPYGFDNDTSSYRTGACPARFYDTNSGGTLYPGNTNANVSAASMVSGWDNRVSSVYIS